jgi:ankyrin repeat protein
MKKHFLLFFLCLILAASAVGNDEVALDEIDKLVRLRNYPEAVSRLQVLAQKGSPEAQFRLAGLYRSGKGVERDLSKSHELYYKAALAGHAQAQFAFALLSEKSRDPTAAAEARKWYRMAAAQGHERAATRLEELNDELAGASIDISTEAVFSAIQHNDEALIDSLISQGANLDLSDALGDTTVMAALLAGWPQLADKLIPAVRYPGQANASGNLPLHLASSRGYRSIVNSLLNSNVDIDQRDASGNTALMLAIKNRHADVAELLLERGAIPGLTNNKNQSAIDIAIILDDAQGRTLLDRYGAKPTDTSDLVPSMNLADFKAAVSKNGALYRGWPLLNIAIQLGEIQVINQLISQGPDLAATDPEGNSALLVAARKGDVDRLRQLLGRGADPNAVNDNRQTAIYLAVDAKCLQCIKLLIDKQADPSIETRTGVTPLEVAIRTSQTDAARLLLAAGGDYAGIHRVLVLVVQKKLDKLASELVARDSRLDVADASGRTVLWHSADLGLEKTAAKLASSGKVDLNKQDKNGRSAISQAVAMGHFKIMRMLAEKGASLTQRSTAGNSLLMLAVLAENPEIVEFLLGQKIDVNAKNNLGNTALMLAAASGQSGVIERLIASGADLQLRNREEMNAFQIATEAGHPKTAQLIYDRSNKLFKLFN